MPVREASSDGAYARGLKPTGPIPFRRTAYARSHCVHRPTSKGCATEPLRPKARILGFKSDMLPFSFEAADCILDLQRCGNQKPPQMSHYIKEFMGDIHHGHTCLDRVLSGLGQVSSRCFQSEMWIQYMLLMCSIFTQKSFNASISKSLRSLRKSQHSLQTGLRVSVNIGYELMREPIRVQ